MMKCFACVLVILALFCGTAFAADPAVIVNQSLSVSSLDAKAVRYIFLGKKTSWNGDGRIIPVVLESGPAHKQFLKQFIKKTPSQFSTHWKRMTFTGRAEGIRIFKSEDDLTRFVAKTPGAIGYISASASASGVKKMSVR